MPGEWAYSIASQLQWVNLIFEVMQEAIILPLFFFVGTVVEEKKEFTNRMRTGMFITLCIYTMLSAAVIVFAEQLLKLMAASPEIIPESVTYIRMESAAYVFSALLGFSLVGLVSMGKEKYLYIFTFVRLLLCMLFDTFLISGLNCSANLGVNGIAVSNIIVNLILLAAVLWMLKIEGIDIFSKEKPNFQWIKKFSQQSILSGMESFVRNLAYMLMICRMVNVVNEQGTYWMANNFIWGWMLLPILQLGELIKRDCSTDHEAMKKKGLGYAGITVIVCVVWVILLPLYKPFMRYVLNYNEAEKLFELVMVLLVPYIFYAFQNIVDSVFYGLGKTQYMLFESVVTNTIYYGIAFILYQTGIFVPSLIGIALLFGFGNIFDAVVSLGAYVFMTKNSSGNS